MKHTILCVDDEIDNVDALERLFRKKYQVLKATSGPMAIEILAQHSEIKLIISDQRMPEMTGVELLEKSIASHPECARILLTGYTDVESVIAAINSGQIYRYVTKPWDPVDLLNAVERGIERVEMAVELKTKNKELEKALIELQSLDRAKNHFMILINHELKTPLTSMISFLGLLQESPLNDEQNLYVKRIVEATDRLRAIVDDVLVIVSSATGQLNLIESEFAPQFLSSAVDQNFESLMNKKSQSIRFEFDEITLKGDKNKILEVTKRMLSNAIRFGNEDSEILLSVKQVAEGHQITLFNYGPLIPDAVRTKILEPFTLNENVMQHSKGTGLGLSVAQAFLKAHDSCLNIQNTSRGVQVSFTLSSAE